MVFAPSALGKMKVTLIPSKSSEKNKKSTTSWNPLFESCKFEQNRMVWAVGKFQFNIYILTYRDIVSKDLLLYSSYKGTVAQRDTFKRLLFLLKGM